MCVFYPIYVTYRKRFRRLSEYMSLNICLLYIPEALRNACLHSMRTHIVVICPPPPSPCIALGEGGGRITTMCVHILCKREEKAEAVLLLCVLILCKHLSASAFSSRSASLSCICVYLVLRMLRLGFRSLKRLQLSLDPCHTHLHLSRASLGLL
jgi:hypothetical protein